jgi:hypothetical protein
MDSSLGGGYSRTVTKTQPYRGLGLVTWADRAAVGGLDVELLRTPVADETGGGGHSLQLWQSLETKRSDLVVKLLTLLSLEDCHNLMPTPTSRDWKDTSVTVAKHRPLDKDTLTRALAHLENDNE